MVYVSLENSMKNLSKKLISRLIYDHQTALPLKVQFVVSPGPGHHKFFWRARFFKSPNSKNHWF